MIHFKFKNLIRKYHFVLFLMLKTMVMFIFKYKIKQKFKFKFLEKNLPRPKPEHRERKVDNITKESLTPSPRLTTNQGVARRLETNLILYQNKK